MTALFLILLFIIMIALMVYLNVVVNDFERGNQQLVDTMEKRYREPEPPAIQEENQPQKKDEAKA